MRLSCALLALCLCACSSPKYSYYFDYVKDGHQLSRVPSDHVSVPAPLNEERVIVLDPNAVSADVRTVPIEIAVAEPVSITSVTPVPVSGDVDNYRPASRKEARKELKSMLRDLREQSKDQQAMVAEDIEKTTDSSKNGFAIAGFVLSLVSLFVLWPLAIPGVIFSAIGMKSDRKGLATAGLILGIIALVLVLAAGAAIAA